MDTDFLFKFNKLIRNLLAENKNRQFFLVVGGGMTTRHYQEGARKVVEQELTNEDLDWIGVHATRLNAHLIRTIFRDLAHPYLVDDYSIIRKITEPILVGAGWKPGWSTDYDAVLMCEDYNAKKIINLTNIAKVYDKDPNKFDDAKPINKISWEELRKLVGEKWTPGMNVPFDPIASKKAQELGISVTILSGRDFDNLEKYFKGEKFVGTVIK
ncbi:MAG: UMP kinase [Patescibacteria group bacterium]|nr:UMP kinase [Patescibacteria group bacterium]